MPDQFVSVVVGTFNRPARLSALLDSLAAQTLPRDSFEVIVVDDGSGPQTGAVLAVRPSALRCRSEASGTSIRWDRQPLQCRLARRPSAADRLHRRRLHGRSGLAERRGRGQRRRSQGHHSGPHGTSAERANGGLLSRSVTVTELGPRYETCNIFYPRATLESLGGFDERFGRRPAAEDMDLAWRAIERGWRTEFAPDARIHHAVEPLGARGMLRVALRWTPAIRVFSEHSQTRVMLYRGLFWNVWHYLLWRSVAASFGPRWRRQMLLTRHLLELRKRARVAGAGASAVPFLIVHDVVECWAIARGAIRYRTLVL